VLAVVEAVGEAAVEAVGEAVAVVVASPGSLNQIINIDRPSKIIALYLYRNLVTFQ
jgi:hypothetical protein